MRKRENLKMLFPWAEWFVPSSPPHPSVWSSVSGDPDQVADRGRGEKDTNSGFSRFKCPPNSCSQLLFPCSALSVMRSNCYLLTLYVLLFFFISIWYRITTLKWFILRLHFSTLSKRNKCQNINAAVVWTKKRVAWHAVVLIIPFWFCFSLHHLLTTNYTHL